MHAIIDPSDTRCRYIRINGARCTIPALKGHDLCFDHQRRKLHKTRLLKAALPETFATIPLVGFAWVEDHASILHNINVIVEALARSAIDLRQAATMNSLQRTALKTLRQMHDLEALRARENQEEPVRDFVLDECELPLAIPDRPVSAPVAREADEKESAAPERAVPDSAPSDSACLPSTAPLADPPLRRIDTTGMSYEDLLRNYYRNDPVALRRHGIEPKPNDVAPSDTQVDSAPAAALTLTAAADPGYTLPAARSLVGPATGYWLPATGFALSPFLSTHAPNEEVTDLDSTLTSTVKNNSNISHTCASRRKFPSALAAQPFVGWPGSRC